MITDTNRLEFLANVRGNVNPVNNTCSFKQKGEVIMTKEHISFRDAIDEAIDIFNKISECTTPRFKS